MSRQPDDATRDHEPPRRAVGLLRWICAPTWLEAIEGDLREQFRADVRRKGRRTARLLYWKEVVLFVRPWVMRREAPYEQARGFVMWKNYLNVAVRRLRKHKGYALLNMLGLAIGLAGCALILRYVQDEWSYDRFHDQADRVYRVVSELTGEGRPVHRLATTPAPLGEVLPKEAPAVERAVRLYPQAAYVARNEARFHEARFVFTDPSFFDVFTFPLAQGDPATALDRPLSVVLTEPMARKYFGDENPIGQPLTVQDSVAFTVTGVLAPLPSNTHLAFDFLTPYASLLPMGRDPQYPWWSFDVYTYLRLAPTARVEEVVPAVYGIAGRYVADQEAQYGTQQRYVLQPLTDIYLHSNLGLELGPTGSMNTVYVFTMIAFVLLAIACINFMNLATARSAERASEVGMRKALGAHRSQLIGQFMGESFVAAGLALVVAVGLIWGALPAFNALSGKAFTTGLFTEAGLWLGLLGMTVLVGLASGSYPALVLSRLASLDALKGTALVSRDGLGLRQGLVVFQFVASVALMVGTMVVNQQLVFMRTQNLGFDKERIVMLPIHGNADVRARYEAVKEALLQLPAVQGVAASNTVPGRTLPGIVFFPEGADESETQSILTLTVDEDFIATIGLDLAAGRGFSRAYGTDPQEAFVINEAAVRHLGWETPEAALGKRFTWGWPGKPGRIVGVVKDFHHTSLQHPVEPVVLHIQPSWYDVFSVRIRADDVPGTLAALEARWAEVVPDRPFEYAFLDAEFDRQYRSEVRLSRLVAVFAGLALFIACLGLFGLAAFTAQQRTKEIGVRKVLGAGVTNIVVLLTKDMVRLVGIAFVIACPLAYLAARRWLGEFAYHIDPGIGTFLLAGGLALGIALLTVSAQAVRAALQDPVKSLRYE